MLNDHQNQQLCTLLNADIILEEALNILVKDNVITDDQANEVYDELR
jgi:type II secretory pathway component PulF